MEILHPEAGERASAVQPPMPRYHHIESLENIPKYFLADTFSRNFIVVPKERRSVPE